MNKKYYVLIICIVFCFCFIQPAPAQANFFLFNIINDILGIGDREKKPPVETKQSPVLRFGMKGSQVIAVQKSLIKAKYLTGTADGVFGYKTLEAVKAFQLDAGLEADGVVGPKTDNALKSFRTTRPKPKITPPSSNPATPPHRGNNAIPNYLYSIPMLVTAYTRYDEGCTDYTYQGTYLRRGLCAVDPSVIPLGTRLYVPGYGEAIADDIGGLIQGNRVDVAMDTLDEAFTWGAQRITVYVLPKGK